MLRSLLMAIVLSTAYISVGLAWKDAPLGFALPWAAVGGIPVGGTGGVAVAAMIGAVLASSSSCRTEVCSAALAVLAMLGAAVGAVAGAVGCAYLAYRWHRKGEREHAVTLYVVNGILGFPALWAAFHLVSQLQGAP